MRYRADLDGLRGIAVAAMVLFHAGTPVLEGGYVGVDVFFVLSGFLIVRLIGAELEAGRFSVVTFYERRARRILPALTAMLSGTVLAGSLLLFPDDLQTLGQSAVATALFLSNVYFWRELDYFAPAAEFLPLLHTWSLGVEEQFYLACPLALMLLMRLPQRYRLHVVAALCIVSLAVSEAALTGAATFSFYWLPARAWELGIGVALGLGLLPPIRAGRASDVAAVAGAAMLAGAILVYDDTTPFPGLHALLPCLGAALIVHAGSEGRPLVNRLLAAPPLVLLGLISYSLYLWHWPILAFVRIRLGADDLPASAAAIAVLASGAFAIASWTYVERPFRDRTRLSGRSVFALSAAATALGAAAGLVLHVTHGLPGRIDEAPARLIAAAKDLHPRHDECEGRPPETLCRLGAAGEPTTLFWGDSHAGALMTAIDIASRQARRASLVAWRGRCPPLLGVRRLGDDDAAECSRFNRRIADWLATEASSVDTVVLIGRWTANATGIRDAGRRIVLAGEDGSVQGGNEALFRHGIEATLAASSAPGRRVVVLGSIPEPQWDVPRLLAKAAWLGIAPPVPPERSEIDRTDAVARVILEGAAKAAGAEFLPLAPLLCDPLCRVGEGDRLYYTDGHHLSAAGGRYIGARLGALIWPRSDAGEPAE